VSVAGEVAGETVPLSASAVMLVLGSVLLGLGVHRGRANAEPAHEATGFRGAVPAPDLAGVNPDHGHRVPRLPVQSPGATGDAAAPEVAPTLDDESADVAPLDEVAPVTPFGEEAPDAVAAGGDCPEPRFYRFAAGRDWARERPTDEEEEALATLLEAEPEARLLIVGHADGAGADVDNLRLSHRRAMYVRRRMLAQGVDPARVTARALGEFAPLEGLASNDAANRRVELWVRGIAGCAGEW